MSGINSNGINRIFDPNHGVILEKINYVTDYTPFVVHTVAAQTRAYIQNICINSSMAVGQMAYITIRNASNDLMRTLCKTAGSNGPFAAHSFTRPVQLFAGWTVNIEYENTSAVYGVMLNLQGFEENE